MENTSPKPSKPTTLTYNDILALFILTPSCNHKDILSAFTTFKDALTLIKPDPKNTHKAYSNLLQVSYEVIKDLEKSDALYAVYVEIVNASSPITELLRNKWGHNPLPTTAKTSSNITPISQG